MSDHNDASVVHPRSWPTDHDTKGALGDYVTWLESDGQEGSELGGVLDFRGSDLTGMRIKWQFLWGSDFSCAVLDRVDFYKSELVGSTLDHASLVGARLHRVEMNECEARGAKFTEANLLKARVYQSVLIEADFRRAWTGGAHFWESDLRGADFRDANFGDSGPGEWTNFSEARVAGCRVAGAEGWVVGPMDVGEENTPSLIGGEELSSWFSSNGAPGVHVVE